MVIPWSRKLPDRTLRRPQYLETLNKAREVMLSIPTDERHGILWRHVAALLEAAAAGNVEVAQAQSMLVRALDASGLL